MVTDEITLEPYLNDKGILMVRCKETKKSIGLLQSACVQNDVDGLPIQVLTLSVLVDTGMLNEQASKIATKIES